MARDVVDAEIIESRDDLVAWLAAGGKPAESFRVGVEHEKFPFYTRRSAAGALRGRARRQGAARRLRRRASAGRRSRTSGALIGLLRRGRRRRDLARAGRPVRTFRRAAADVHADRRRTRRAFDLHARGRRAAGDRLLRARHEPEMDARRNAGHAEEPLPHHGALHAEGRNARPRHDVPHLDRAGQSRFRRRSRHGRQAARRPGAAADDHGAVRQFAVHRRRAQRTAVGPLGDLAPHRRGAHRHARRSPSSRAWASSATSTTRSTCRCISSSAATVYHDVAGASFRDLLEGKLAALPGERATVSDWANHLSTIFPEVRLKRYLEMRGADVGPRERILALAALMLRSVLRQGRARRRGARSIDGWTAGDRQRLRDDVPRLGLKARIGGRPLLEVAREAVAIAARRAGAAGAARRRRTRRDPLSRAAGAHRRRRAHAGGSLDRPLQRPLAGLGRSGFPRSGDLNRDIIATAGDISRTCAASAAAIHVRFIRTSSHRRRRSKCGAFRIKDLTNA